MDNMILKIFILLFSLSSNLSQEKQIIQSKTDTTITSHSNLPPIKLLEDNFSISSHVAVIAVKQVEIAEKIYSDDGKLGYVVLKSTGDLLENLKGDFDSTNKIVYYNFLEYSPELEKNKLDTMLVFMKKDKKTNNLLAFEVGQFKYGIALKKLIGNMIEKKYERE